MKQYKIGEVAKLLGLTTQAIRFYEQEGVVSPVKSETGTRYYSIDQIVMLLCLKKYRQSDFSIQQVAAHFTDDDLSSLHALLSEKRDELLRRSEELIRRANAVNNLARQVERACRTDLPPKVCERPLMHLLTPSLDDLGSATPRQREALYAFIDAMPDAQIAFFRDPALTRAPRFHLLAEQDVAERWRLPLEDTVTLSPVRCAEATLRLHAAPADRQPMLKLYEQLERMGLRRNPNEEVLCTHIASETIGGTVYLYARAYVPLL